MKTAIIAIVSVIVGFGAGYFLSATQSYKPTEIGTQQVDSVQLMDLSNKLAIANAEIVRLKNPH